MARRTKEEFIKIFSEYAGDRDDDATLGIMEDISDSFADGFDGKDWKTKYEENDRAWRQKYKERFMNMSNTGTLEPDPPGSDQTSAPAEEAEGTDSRTPEEMVNDLFGM